jgi:hypothetical protein
MLLFQLIVVHVVYKQAASRAVHHCPSSVCKHSTSLHTRTGDSEILSERGSRRRPVRTPTPTRPSASRSPPGSRPFQIEPAKSSWPYAYLPRPLLRPVCCTRWPRVTAFGTWQESATAEAGWGWRAAVRWRLVDFGGDLAGAGSHGCTRHVDGRETNRTNWQLEPRVAVIL